MVTILGMDVAGMLGGVLFIENVFALPGIGTLAVQSVFNLDPPMIMGTVLFSAALVVGANWVVDLIYGWIDPRIKSGTLNGLCRCSKFEICKLTLAAVQTRCAPWTASRSRWSRAKPSAWWARAVPARASRRSPSRGCWPARPPFTPEARFCWKAAMSCR